MRFSWLRLPTWRLSRQRGLRYMLLMATPLLTSEHMLLPAFPRSPSKLRPNCACVHLRQEVLPDYNEGLRTACLVVSIAAIGGAMNL